AWSKTLPPCPSALRFAPCDLPFGATIGFIPLTAGAGLAVPHTLMGGRAGIGFGLAGGLAGYMTATSALGLLSLFQKGNRTLNTDWPSTAPGAGTGLIATLSLAGAGCALELPQPELEACARAWSLLRSF